MVHESIHGPLEGLAPMFKHVLMLVTGLTAPQANPEEVEAVCEFGAGVVAGVITKKSIWCSPFLHE